MTNSHSSIAISLGLCFIQYFLCSHISKIKQNQTSTYFQSVENLKGNKCKNNAKFTLYKCKSTLICTLLMKYYLSLLCECSYWVYTPIYPFLKRIFITQLLFFLLAKLESTKTTMSIHFCGSARVTSFCSVFQSVKVHLTTCS